MSKYTFKKIDDDNIEFAYKDKKFTITRDVELQKDIQDVYNQARLKMLTELTKAGLTKQNFTIVKEENGKKYYDNSNLLELENHYVGLASAELFDNFSKRFFDMSFGDLLNDVGLEGEEINKFGYDLGQVLRGEEKTPSQKEK